MTRILLVDNDATRASLLKDILEGPGHYELLNCSDLTSAQEIYRNGHPHVSLVMCACEVGDENPDPAHVWLEYLSTRRKKVIALSEKGVTGLRTLDRQHLDANSLLQTISQVLGC